MERVKKLCVNKKLVGELKFDREFEYFYVAIRPDLREEASRLINGNPSDGIVGKKKKKKILLSVGFNNLFQAATLDCLTMERRCT